MNVNGVTFAPTTHDDVKMMAMALAIVIYFQTQSQGKAANLLLDFAKLPTSLYLEKNRLLRFSKLSFQVADVSPTCTAADYSTQFLGGRPKKNR